MTNFIDCLGGMIACRPAIALYACIAIGMMAYSMRGCADEWIDDWCHDDGSNTDMPENHAPVHPQMAPEHAADTTDRAHWIDQINQATRRADSLQRLLNDCQAQPAPKSRPVSPAVPPRTVTPPKQSPKPVVKPTPKPKVTPKVQPEQPPKATPKPKETPKVDPKTAPKMDTTYIYIRRRTTIRYH